MPDTCRGNRLAGKATFFANGLGAVSNGFEFNEEDYHANFAHEYRLVGRALSSRSRRRHTKLRARLGRENLRRLHRMRPAGLGVLSLPIGRWLAVEQSPLPR